MRRPIIAGNWKMYKTPQEAVEFVVQFKEKMADIYETDVILAPPFPALVPMKEKIVGTDIKLAGQNAHWESEGAFTGEVSPLMLVDAGCRYVIIGHSERRQFFGETNITANKKVRAVLDHGLNPILCVGETLEERETKQTEAVIAEQVEQGLKGIELESAASLVLAYEPVWAIGTGVTAKVDDAQQVNAFIRELLSKIFNVDLAEKIRLQYGGSVKADNISEILAKPDVDGALVGGASLDVEGFAEMIWKCEEALTV